jgi:tetratricopeptide (TPR) repeat protein
MADVKPMPTTVDGKIEEAQRLKTEGNGFVKAQNFKKAISCYLRSHMFISGPGFSEDNGGGMGALAGQQNGVKLSDEQKAVVEQLVNSMNSNLALCYLKEGRNEKCVERASAVLKNDSDNTKCLFRRGVARANLNDFDRAREDLEAAEKLSPDDKGTKREIAKLNKR